MPSDRRFPRPLNPNLIALCAAACAVCAAAGGAACRAEKPGDERWLASSFRGLAPGRENRSDPDRDRQKLDSIIGGVKDGEQLFRNIDVEYTEEYVLPSFDKEQYPVDMIKEFKRVAHLVAQDDSLYFKEKVTGTATKGPYTDERMIRWDGKVLRTLWTQTGSAGNSIIANITDERPNPPSARTPLNMGRRPSEVRLSETLGQAVLNAGSNAEEISKVILKEDELIGGIACVKVAYRVERKQQKGPLDAIEEVIWLAAQNHYLPVRKAWMWRKLDKGLPDEITETSDWREIEPGVSVPFKAVITQYKDGPNGERISDARTTTTITRISLRPAYDPGYFTEVSIPKGAHVYVYKGGEPVAGYIEGEEAGKRDEINWAVGVWVLVAGAFLFLVAAIWKVRRRTSKTCAAPS